MLSALWLPVLASGLHLPANSGLVRLPAPDGSIGRRNTLREMKKTPPARRGNLRGVQCRGVLDDLTEEAESGWLNRFLPRREGANRTRVKRSDISEQPVMFTTVDDPTFDFARWQNHRSPSRYSRLVLGILFGKTTQRIAPLVLLIGLFSTLIFSYNNLFLPATQLISIRSRYPELQLPLTPFELTAPVLGLLLVFRTDTAYNRFKEGSQLTWEITGSIRTHMRRLLAFTGTPAFTDAERDAAMQIAGASCQLHGLIMNSYLRGGGATQEAQAQVVRDALGLSGAVDGDADGDEGGDEGGGGALLVSDAPLSPYLCLSAITLGVAQRLSTLTDQERIALDDCFSTIATDLAKCEEIVATPIPLGYTRASVRFLWIWITLLPLALSRTFTDFQVGTWWEDKPYAELPVLLAAMLFISFIFVRALASPSSPSQPQPASASPSQPQPAPASPSQPHPAPACPSLHPSRAQC